MMEYGSILGVNKPVARLILGTMIISINDHDRSFALLDAAYEFGYTCLDTAHGYDGGDSERGLGLWMQERGNRDKMTIITKGCHHNVDRTRLTSFDLTSDLYDSLARLRTDYIDVYLLHRDDPSVPVGPLVETLNEHLQAGRIHAFGASNWTHQRIAMANEYARTHGLTSFVASSPNYGLAEQVEDPWGGGCVTISGFKNRGAQKWYAANQMPILAYSSLARGLFSGRITPENYQNKKSTLDQACRKAYCHRINFKRLERAILLSIEKEVSVPQLVLAYIFGSPMNVFPIVGAAQRRELEDNVQAFNILMTDRERSWLDLEIE